MEIQLMLNLFLFVKHICTFYVRHVLTHSSFGLKLFPLPGHPRNKSQVLVIGLYCHLSSATKHGYSTFASKHFLSSSIEKKFKSLLLLLHYYNKQPAIVCNTVTENIKTNKNCLHILLS